MGTVSTKLNNVVRLRRGARRAIPTTNVFHIQPDSAAAAAVVLNPPHGSSASMCDTDLKSIPASSTMVTLVSINPLHNNDDDRDSVKDAAVASRERPTSSSASSSSGACDEPCSSSASSTVDEKSVPAKPSAVHMKSGHTTTTTTSATIVKSFEDVMALLNADGRWQAGVMIACLFSCVALSISNYAQGIFFVGKLERTCAEFGAADGTTYRMMMTGMERRPLGDSVADPVHVSKLAPSLDNNVAVMQFGLVQPSAASVARAHPLNITRAKSGAATVPAVTGAAAEDSEADATCVAPRTGAKCRAWNYSSTYYGYTMQNEWNLVCEQAYKIPLFQSSYLIGYMVGMPLFGAIADIYGRRMVITIAWPILMASFVATAFAPAYWLVAVMRGLQGLLSGGDWKAKYVLTMEVTSIGRRNMMSVLLGSCFPLAAITATIMAYYIRDWRMLQLICIIPAILSFPLLFFIPESPRWLITHAKYEEAHEVLKRGARINRRKLPVDLDLKTLHDLHGQDDTQLKSPLSHFRALFTGAEMRKRSCILCIQWFVAELVFNGVMFYGTGVVPGDPYLTLIAMSVFRLFNNPVQIFVFNRFGVRNSHIVLLFLTAVALGAMGSLPESWMVSATWTTFVSLALLVLGNSFIDACVGALDILTTELYPTSLRQTGFGVCSMWAQVGAGISPFIADMLAAHVWRPLPAIVFSALCVIAALVVLLWLPTLDNTALPDTIHDAEQIAAIAAAVANSSGGGAAAGRQDDVEREKNKGVDAPAPVSPTAAVITSIGSSSRPDGDKC